jgi:hypothetical protein
MTYADLGRVLGKGADAASNYCEGSAEMGVIAFMLAWREWNGRWSGPVKRFCEETRPKAVDDRIASHAVLSAATALSQALSDGNMLDAEDIRKNRRRWSRAAMPLRRCSPSSSRRLHNGPARHILPALGRMPTLQFCRPVELHIDPSYQRDASSEAQLLIKRIAQTWNWDLCQPLVVARRQGLIEQLFVIDGQHRLAAARLRGDIDQLPCVILSYANAADEAKNFVTLNQQRRPLSKLELFKAAVASGDAQAIEIVAAMNEAGLSIAPIAITSAGSRAWCPISAASKPHGVPTVPKPARSRCARCAMLSRAMSCNMRAPSIPASSLSVTTRSASVDRLAALASMLCPAHRRDVADRLARPCPRRARR